MNRIRYVLSYIKHFVSARNTKGYGIHSPYIFHLTTSVLTSNHLFYVFDKIEKLRSKLKMNSKRISVSDFGTGNDGNRSIRFIAKYSLKSPKQAQLLFRIALHLNAKYILELGTSFGITTSYLASISNTCKCITLEGCPEIAKIANENFDQLGLKNIELIVGDIDLKLQEILIRDIQLDLVFIDANHKFDAVINYFNRCYLKLSSDSIVVVDDIHWSKDMERAWEIIKNHPNVTSSIDLFHMGIVFFNTDLHRKHYKIRY